MLLLTYPKPTLASAHRAAVFDSLKKLTGGDDDDEWLPRVLIATAEGLQIQWLRDPGVDVAGDMRRLHPALLSGRPPKRSPDPGASATIG
jgi:hypothetical protein